MNEESEKIVHQAIEESREQLRELGNTLSDQQLKAIVLVVGNCVKLGLFDEEAE